MMMRKCKILVLTARDRDLLYMTRNSHLYDFVFTSVDFDTRKNVFEFDILAYLERLRRIVKEEKVDGVYYSSDLGAVLAGVLVEEFSFVGPSVSGAFAAYHKYYTRKLVDTGVGFFDVFELDNFPQLADYPVYMKAPCSAVGVLGFTIRTEEDLDRVKEVVKEQLPKMNDATRPLFEKYVDLEKFPLAIKDVMLLEQFVDKPQLTVEGFVFEGQVRFTVITDTNMHGRLIESFSMPTALSEEMQERLKEVAERDILALGLDNSFFNIEYWYDKDGFTLIEVNARAAACFHRLYFELYGYDLFKAMCELALGRCPQVVIDSDKCAAQVNITTLQEGRCGDLFDFEAAKSFDLKLFRQPEEEVKQISEFGAVIAQANLVANSFEEIREKAAEMRRVLLKDERDRGVWCG